MIEDKELRDIFKAEVEERMQKLDKRILHLEKNPKDQANLEELLREAHSIKGAARMLGIRKIEKIAHHMEEIIGRTKQGKITVTSEIIDLLFKGLDTIRKLAEEATTGGNSEVDVVSIISDLGSAVKEKHHEKDVIPEEDVTEFEDKPSAVKVQKSEIKESWHEKRKTSSLGKRESKKKKKITSETSEEAAKPHESDIHAQLSIPESHHLDTIRVETKKLDTLMTYAGELVVSKTHITRRLSDIDKIVELWEEWNKDVSSQNFLLKKVEHDYDTKSVKKLISFNKSERRCIEKIGKILKNTRKKSYEDNTRLEYVVNELEEKICNIRLMPFSNIFNLYPRMVREISKAESKNVSLVIEGKEISADKKILEEMKDPLTHLIRNAIGHGIEMPAERDSAGKDTSGTIYLRVFKTATKIVVEVEDDGGGLDINAIKRIALKRRITNNDALNAMSPTEIQSLIFTPGFSTDAIATDISGRGIGLDVVRTNVERLKGTVKVESTAGVGTIFSIQLPATLATTRVLIIGEKDGFYALPIEHVQTSRIIKQNDIFSIEGRKTITYDGHPISVSYLSEMLELKDAGPKARNHKELTCIILLINNDHVGIIVDALLDEQEVVLKTQCALLKRVRNVLGTAILATGNVCTVLNPYDLQKTMKKQTLPFSVQSERSAEEERKKAILLVDDSITTRTQEKRILESASYEVITAVDGVDAWNKLNTRFFDAVVSDIQMPNMDGWVLTEKIRKDKKFKDIPIVLVTTLSSDEDKKRGIEIGANAYISKPAFDQKTFLNILERLI